MDSKATVAPRGWPAAATRLVVGIAPGERQRAEDRDKQTWP